MHDYSFFLAGKEESTSFSSVSVYQSLPLCAFIVSLSSPNVHPVMTLYQIQLAPPMDELATISNSTVPKDTTMI